MPDTPPDWVWALLAAPFAGSLLGVLARRLPAGRPVVLARSDCDSCHVALRPRELIPLVSYLWQRGRCRHCGAPIGLFHPLMELGCVGVALWAALLFDGSALWASCVLGWLLLALAVCDQETRLLPDALTLPLLLLGLGANFLLDAPSVTDRALAAACGFLLFRGIAWLYRRMRGREGLGGGDAKLLAAAGAWVGLAALPWVIVLAACGGILLALRGGRASRHQELPFGPALALATWVVWLYAL